MQAVLALLSKKDSPSGYPRLAIPTAELSTSGRVVFNALAAQEQSAREAVTDNITFANAALVDAKSRAKF